MNTEEKPHNKAVFGEGYHLLKSKAFGLLLIFFLVVRLAIALLLPQKAYLQASDLVAANILNAVNNERSLRNLGLLSTNSELTRAAQTKSADMITRHYFAHIDPDGHYIWDTIVADGYTPYTQLGENLAIEFYDTQSLISAWMNSPEHRANILQPDFRDQGMAVSFGDVEQGQYYSAITNTFGTLVSEVQPATKVSTTLPKTQTSVSKPATSPTPIGSTPPLPTHTSLATPTPSTTPVSTLSQPLNIRGQEDSGSSIPLPNFALAQPHQTTSSEPVIVNQPSTAVVGSNNNNANGYDTTRYLILLCGIGLLLLMARDIKIALDSKLQFVDKKFNNLALLIISLVVIAFIYWL